MKDSQNKVINTILEMLEQREYKIQETDETDVLIAIKPDGNQMCVFTEIVDKYNVKNFQATVARMNELKIKHGIIVFGAITPATNKMVSGTAELRLIIESFTEQELRYNPTKHRLVPLHESLGKDGSKAFREEYSSNWKIIKVDDPISRFYAFRKGEIIKITRKDGFVDYRIVK